MMRNFSRILLIFFIFSSCKSPEQKIINDYYPNGKLMTQKVYLVTKKKPDLISETQYYENGNMKLEGKYVEGERNGKWIQWYKNGQIWSEGEFENGLRTGKSTVYNQDGTINYTGFYKLGKPDAEWTFFDENEKVAKKVVYKEGKIIDEENFQVPFQ